MDFDLGAPLELVPEVNHFLQGSAESLEEEVKEVPSPEPQAEELDDLEILEAGHAKLVAGTD